MNSKKGKLVKYVKPIIVVEEGCCYLCGYSRCQCRNGARNIPVQTPRLGWGFDENDDSDDQISDSENDSDDHGSSSNKPNAADIEDISAKLANGDLEPRFWEIIESFGWRNMSEGGPKTRTTPGLSRINKEIFAYYYPKKHNSLGKIILDNEIGGSTTDMEKMISHAIGLGRESYEILSGEPLLLKFLFESNECSNLFKLIKIYIKM